MSRRHNFQTVGWFHDLWQRKLLDLDPPYQRRSVWNQQFKDYFVDTVLLNYPAPALFLYEEISAAGRSMHFVVDGKQRLTALFEFIRGDFPVSDKSDLGNLRGKYFTSLDDATKKAFWGYQFLVEYVPTSDDNLINAIFDRINRNVAKLTPQELRHAKLDGTFIQVAEALSDWMTETLPRNFPRFAQQSRQQMKDVEFVALLLLLTEEGPKGYSQEDLDKAFTERDESWDARVEVEGAFREAISKINEIVESNQDLLGTRLKNQADFYSLYGAVQTLLKEKKMCSYSDAASRLLNFTSDVETQSIRESDANLTKYFDAARSASNDKGPRENRISIMVDLLSS